MTKLFVGGLPYSLTNQQLEELFAKFGAVQSATIVMDKYSGQSKGFGFVEMADDAAAQEAIKNLEGFALDGRKIGVSVARPREDNQNRGGFGNNSGGGDNRRRDNFRSGGGSGRDGYRR